MRQQSDLLEVHPALWNIGEDTGRWPLSSHSISLQSSRLIKSGAGKLYGFTVFNSNAATRFILLYDAIAVPANADTTFVAPFAVGASQTLMVSYGDAGRSFDNGCLLVNSTASTSLTLGAADQWFDAQYV